MTPAAASPTRPTARRRRAARATPSRAPFGALLGALLGGVLLATTPLRVAPAHAEDARAREPDALDLLRVVESASASLPARREAAEALARFERFDDVERVVRAVPSLFADAPATAGRLLRAALEAGWAAPDLRAAVAASAARTAAKAPSPDARFDLAAVGLLLGDRAPVGALLAAGEAPSPFALEVLRDDAPHLDVPERGLAPTDREAHDRLAALLGRAVEDDPKVAFPAMDALKARGKDAVPYLSAVAVPRGPAASRPGARTGAGAVGRRVRAVVLLGALGDRGVVPSLVPLLDDREDGWVRAAAATALGDLGDPRAIGPLCRVLLYLGDRHRPADLWDYPGSDNTALSPEAWADVPYYAVDVAAADALLRLGVRNAAEWLIDERLDPRTGRWRVRVTQDAIEAIRAAFPGAPAGYEPDAGFPQRQAAVEALRGWWRTGPVLPAPIEARDDAVDALVPLAESVGGAGVAVMDLMIAKRACVLVGPAMTPAVVRVLATSRRRVQRAELAVVLGGLRDRRAVRPLLDLTHDPVPAVRANAAEALGAYLDPELPALVFGPDLAPAPTVEARLLALLADPDAGPRASALKALCLARPSPQVREALRAEARALAEGTEASKRNDFVDFRLACDVALLVHDGEGERGPAGTRLDVVVGHLAAPDLFRRRYVWELLRPALRLDSRAFDPVADPGRPGPRAPRAETLREALRTALERRSAR